MSRDVVLGFDPASRAGWAALDFDARVIESGTWLVRRGDYTGDRWLALHGHLAELFERYRGRVAALAIERPPVYDDVRWNTIRILFGQAALAEMVAARYCVDAVFVHPSQLKKRATGSGRATKAEVVDAVVAETGPLSVEPGGDTKAEQSRREKARSDEADARASALWLLDRYDRDALVRGELIAKVGDGS